MSTSTPESAAKNAGETASNPASGSNPASAAKPASAKSAPVTIWRWRVVDIVVASVLGVAAGLIFLAWNVGYLGPKALL